MPFNILDGSPSTKQIGNPGTKEFDWKVVILNDGGMIQKMARENSTQRKLNIQTLFESIRAAVETYGAGRISMGEGAGEIHPAPKTNLTQIRYAPAYSLPNRCSPAAGEDTKFPYTMQTLAVFLGFVQPNGTGTASFEAAFGALELLKEGYLTESRIKGLEVYKIAEVVSVVKQQRAKAARIGTNKTFCTISESSKCALIKRAVLVGFLADPYQPLGFFE